MKKHLWWLAAVALALGLVAQYAIYRSESPAVPAHASWVSQPETFNDLVNEAKVIVEAEVVAVNEGKPIVVPVKGEPGGQDIIPTQNITVRVISADKGDARVGQNLAVFRTGGTVQLPNGPARGDQPLDEHRGTDVQEAPPGDKPKADPNLPVPDRKVQADPDAPPPVSVKVMLLPEDPAYTVGGRVYLALTDGPDGLLRPVAPSGRYDIAGDGTMRAIVTDDALAASINGQPLNTVKSAARGEGTVGNPEAKRRVTSGEETVGMPRTGDNHETFQWIVFFSIGMVLVAGGLVTLALSGIRSAVANRRRD